MTQLLPREDASDYDDDDEMPSLLHGHDDSASDDEDNISPTITTKPNPTQHDTDTFSDEESDEDNVLKNNVSDAIKIKVMEKANKILGKKRMTY